MLSNCLAIIAGKNSLSRAITPSFERIGKTIFYLVIIFILKEWK